MGFSAIPRMSRGWKVIALAMTTFGFVYGYAVTAGQPCGSLGQCLQYLADLGFGGFSPSSLIPGAVGALSFAAVTYGAFLAWGIIQKSVHGRPTARNWRGALARPTPLTLAVGAAVAWAILSVGPGRFVGDLAELIPRDTVTSTFCMDFLPVVDGRCSGLGGGNAPDLSPPGVAPADLTRPQCVGWGLGVRPEADGQCHERSGGDASPLADDIRSGGAAGLLAFLVVGAALLLWPRLRAASQPPVS